MTRFARRSTRRTAERSTRWLIQWFTSPAARRLDDRLAEGLDEITERAVVSPTALADFHDRVARTRPHEEEVVVMLTPEATTRTPKGRPRWVVPAIGAVAAAVLALAGVIALGSGEDDAVTVDEGPSEVTLDETSGTVPTSEATTEPTTDPATTEPTTTEPVTVSGDAEAELVISDWSRALAGVTALPSPEPAGCPNGDPVTAVGLGVVEVPEFLEGNRWTSIQALAAFDSATNSLVVVRRGARTVDDVIERDTVAGRLDVCTGEWTQIDADFGLDDEGQPRWPGALVYDVDSDALVAFVSGYQVENPVRVYDPLADEWTARPDTIVLRDEWGRPVEGMWPISAVYHPASGAIIVHGGDLAAYDVDLAEWRRIGSVWQLVEDVNEGAAFLGIDATLDRFVVEAGDGDTHVTYLVEPETGVTTAVPTPGRPYAKVWNGYGPDEVVGQVDGTVFVGDHEAGTVCGFDAETLAWDRCVDLPTGDETDPKLGAIVGDPVNGLVMMVPPYGPILTAPLP